MTEIYLAVSVKQVYSEVSERLFATVFRVIEFGSVGY